MNTNTNKKYCEKKANRWYFALGNTLILMNE